jgi:hypothetical protein
VANFAFRVVGAGIVRTFYLSQLEGFDDLDKTWLGFNTFVAGIAEGNIGIVCACVPSLKRFFGQWFRDKSTGAGSGSEGGSESESNGRPGEAAQPTAASHFNFNGKSVLISTVSEEPYDMEERLKFGPESYPTTSQSSKGAPNAVHEEESGRQGEAFHHAYP